MHCGRVRGKPARLPAGQSRPQNTQYEEAHAPSIAKNNPDGPRARDGAAAAYGVWRGYARQPPTLAAQQLQAAAAQRPVDKTDQLIWDYQQRVQQNPDDVQSYAVLGAAYLQKARDIGDPTYYAKAQAAIDAALARDPQNVEALIGAGTLANARHQFHDALALGQRARALNPSVPRVWRDRRCADRAGPVPAGRRYIADHDRHAARP